MDGHFLCLWRSAVALLALLALAGAGPVSAGIFATEGVIADFTFTGGTVDYSLPALGEVTLTLTSENGVELKVDDDQNSSTVFDPTSGFTGKLNLNAKKNASGPTGGAFMIYGSLPSAQYSDAITLIKETLDAMQEDSSDGSLGLLFSGKATTGALARQYLSLGIYERVAGLDEAVWSKAYTDTAGSVMNLQGSDQSSQAGGDPRLVPAVPAPTTALLILTGLFALGYRRCRALTSGFLAFPRA